MNHWQRFYSVVVVLLLLDCAWGKTVRLHATPEGVQVIAGWISLNIKTIVGLLILLGIGWWRPGTENSTAGHRSDRNARSDDLRLPELLEFLFSFVLVT